MGVTDVAIKEQCVATSAAGGSFVPELADSSRRLAVSLSAAHGGTLTRLMTGEDGGRCPVAAVNMPGRQATQHAAGQTRIERARDLADRLRAEQARAARLAGSAAAVIPAGGL